MLYLHGENPMRKHSVLLINSVRLSIVSRGHHVRIYLRRCFLPIASLRYSNITSNVPRTRNRLQSTTASFLRPLCSCGVRSDHPNQPNTQPSSPLTVGGKEHPNPTCNPGGGTNARHPNANITHSGSQPVCGPRVHDGGYTVGEAIFYS
ncbi:uncharacterized protein EI97DRAFT_223642 [Westerdykella ornata]|uniref:Uncharacterized protein n=1 Tax=Westerdykella ornata TaxID=318751 RepID=A0A6A6JQV8_WESOR|nr:uncharacterized protein EI97DRAFT_223642 [Westerdykella ornata]KAF2278932.1 hypothetical protein EI97DRAFT_223642 [Westerdykella ornata]